LVQFPLEIMILQGDIGLRQRGPFLNSQTQPGPNILHMVVSLQQAKSVRLMWSLSGMFTIDIL